MKTSVASLIRFKNAALGYGKTPILTKVDLDILPGTFWGILGHNGSGKTTILKTMLGLIPCLRGELAEHGGLFGKPRFGYVPQKERLDPLYPLSSRAVAAMGTYRKLDLLQRLRGAGRDGIVNRCLADCGATHLAERRLSDLSGGQKQRVLIARALAAEPEILVLDEPLAGIDITTQQALLKLLKDLREQRNLTVLMVSHRISAEKGLFTDVAWVDEGRVTTGPSEAMFASGKISEVFKSEL
ncbi:MAG: ABC transporter [Elusimicrobia bacterium CG11_big_fil_rev_8_21_14_0_20_64_6]|nr:MAG: ABC transporter [Elusimicrobia bacterium CG11_big_fil_rev_8_21_14_0_20_64_6]